MTMSLIEKKLQRAERKIAILERMIEDSTRDLFLEQEKLQRSKKFLETILDTVKAGIVVINPDRIILLANQASQDTLETNELIGSSLESVFSPEFLHEIAGTDGHIETVLVGPKTQQRKTLMCAQSAFDSANSIPEFHVIMLHDVTEQKKLEQLVMQSQRLQSVGSLAMGIAHEINTPIQYVRDNTLFVNRELENVMEYIKSTRAIIDKLAEDPALSTDVAVVQELYEALDLEYVMAEMPKALAQTYEGAESVASIVKSIKEFSHPGSEEKEFANVNRAIESTLAVCKNEWKSVAAIDLNLDPELPEVLCFPGEINQALLNLVVNAAQAIESQKGKTPDLKGEISISTLVRNKHVVILVKDNGCGIAEEDCKRVFDPFFTTKEVGKGTGQGLSLVYASITERLGGEVLLTSKKGKGTTFTINIPMQKSE